MYSLLQGRQAVEDGVIQMRYPLYRTKRRNLDYGFLTYAPSF